MNLNLIDPCLVGVVMLNFLMLGIVRLRSIIYIVAVQGAILGLIYPLTHTGDHGEAPEISLRLLGLAAAMVVVKGFVMPQMLLYAMQRADVQRRIEPLIGLTASVLLGAVGTAAAMALAPRLPLQPQHASHLLVSASLSTVLAGFLILATRREALTQVVGYLVLENGIFIFGLLLVRAMPFLVELGVLLDLFVGVFVMGIIVHHVSRQLPTAGADPLRALKE